MKSLVTNCAVVGLVLAAGCDPKSDGIEAVAEPTGFAVFSTDYTTAAIALLGPDGKLVKERFVSSGSEFEGLGNPLVSDTTLPTNPGEAGILTYVERRGTDQVTRIDIEAGEVLTQLRTQASTDEGFSANPQDYLYIDDTHAWVTRYAQNPDKDAKAVDKGNDMLLINPADGKRTSTRIGFEKFNSTGTVENPDTGEESEVTIFARPGAMAFLGDKVVVTLSRLSDAFDAIDDGMVAIVDLDEKTAEGLELDGLQNCSELTAVRDDDTRLIVSCAGFYRGDRQATAGIVVLHTTNGEIEVERTWKGADHEDDALAVTGLVSLGGNLVLAIEDGVWGESSDKAHLVDLESGKQTEIVEANGAFVLGSGWFIAEENLLLLPDASTDDDGVPNAGVRRFVIEDGEVTSELKVLKVDEALAPRTVRPLY